MNDIPCRRCGEVTGAMTRLWRTSPGGRLAPYAAQHRTPCRPARAAALAMGTASRPGPCSGCMRDVIPGDKITSIGGTGVFHLECAPPDAAAPAGRPERARIRRRPAV